MSGKILKKTILTAALLLQSGALLAQSDSLKNNLNIGLDYLAHGEVRGGGLPKPSDPGDVVEDRANFLMGRMRLTLGYEREWLEAKAVLKNTGVWGSSSNMDIGMYEAWVKVKAKCGLFGQVGRMVLAYDDERIIGPNDFAMAAASHDALRIGYEGHGHKVHAILSFNQNDDNPLTGTYYENGAQDYKSMQTLWYHYDVPKFPLGASVLFMNIGMQSGVQNDKYNSPHTTYQQLIGGYLHYQHKYVTAEAAYYHQLGKTVINNYDAKLNAWMAGGKITITPSDRYAFLLGYDYLSGDDYVAVVKPGMLGMVRHDVMKGFAPLYGSRTKFYGLLDYFYESAYLNGFTPGLQDAFFGVRGNPWPKLTISAVYHYLAVTTDLEGLGRTLGHNIDIQVSYRFSTELAIYAGYTQMLGTETMDRLKQGNDNKHVQWGWASLVVSPSLFKAKW